MPQNNARILARMPIQLTNNNTIITKQFNTNNRPHYRLKLKISLMKEKIKNVKWLSELSEGKQKSGVALPRFSVTLNYSRR